MKPLTAAALSLIFLGCTPAAPAEFSADDGRAIREVLARQQQAWNSNSIDAFMNGYWKSDSLRFIGSRITTGWQATLDRYKQTYPTPDAMGRLTFEILAVDGLSANAALVTGRYTLTRQADTPTGLFTLVFKKINTRWVIVYDHTS